MDSASLTSRVFRFGPFELSEREGELRKDGTRIKLQEQPFRVLVELVANAGRVVTREELQQKLWSAETFVDFDVGLNTAIRKLRQALGDDADEPRYIETQARRGYRFVAPVADAPVLPASIETKPAPVMTQPTAPISRVRRRIAIAAGLVVLAIAAWAGVRGLRGWLHPSRHIQSIAILPLENLSNDPAQEYFADGMTDALTTDVSQINALRVISRTSAMRYKKSSKSLPEIARDLNVEDVVEGSVMRSGNRVRITAQLIHASTDDHIWAATYERDLDDVLKLQREVAQDIARQLRAKLSPQQQARFAMAGGVNPQAYEAYLRGRAYAYGDFKRQSLRKAQAYFEEAVRKDPGFSPAYVGLADTYEGLGSIRWIPPQEAFLHAGEAVSKALELDNNLGEAHSSLGRLEWRYAWDWPNAEREFRRAVELSPNYARAHIDMAIFLAWNGKRAESLAEIAKARDLDPATPSDDEVLYYHLRDYGPMVENGRKLVAANPDSWLLHYFLGVAYEGSGQTTAAVDEYEKAVQLSEDNTDPTAALAHAYATAGERAKAVSMVRNLLQESKTSYVSPYMIATIYAGLGEKDKAFGYLEKAYEERSPDVPYFIKADLRLDSLRSDQRFHELERKIGQPQ